MKIRASLFRSSLSAALGLTAVACGGQVSTKETASDRGQNGNAGSAAGDMAGAGTSGGAPQREGDANAPFMASHA